MSSRRRSQRLQRDDPVDFIVCNLARVPSIQRLTFGILSPPNSPQKPCSSIPVPSLPALILPTGAGLRTYKIKCISSVAPSYESSPAPPEKKMGSPCSFNPNGMLKSMEALLQVISRVSPARTEIPIQQFTPVRTDFPEITASIMSRAGSPNVTEEMKTIVASAFATATKDMVECKTASEGNETKDTKIVQLAQPKVRSLSFRFTGIPFRFHRINLNPILP